MLVSCVSISAVFNGTVVIVVVATVAVAVTEAAAGFTSVLVVYGVQRRRRG